MDIGFQAKCHQLLNIPGSTVGAAHSARLVFHQIIHRHMEQSADCNQIADVGIGLPCFPPCHRLTGHIHFFRQIFLGQPLALSEQLQLF